MTTSKIVTRVTSINRAKIVYDAVSGLPDGTPFDLTNMGTLFVHDGPFKGAYRTVKVKAPRWLGDNGHTFERDLNAADTITLNGAYSSEDQDYATSSDNVRERHFARLIALIELNSSPTSQPTPTTREQLQPIEAAPKAKLTPCQYRQVVIDRAIETDHVFTLEDVEKSNNLRLVAIDFAMSYTGNGYFMKSLRTAVHQNGGTLSPKQMRAALDAMVNEYKAAQVAPKPPTTAPSAFYVDMSGGKAITGESVAQREHAKQAIAALAAIEAVMIPNGTYTVPISDDGDYRVIRLVDCPEKYNKPAGTQIAEYQHGPDNVRDYTGFAFVNGTEHSVWSKFRNAREIGYALTNLLSLGKAQEFGKIWAMAAQRCYICGKKLTTPDSKQAGIGPICAENNGISMAAMMLLGTKDAAIEENDMRARARRDRATIDIFTAERQAKAQAEIDELFPE